MPVDLQPRKRTSSKQGGANFESKKRLTGRKTRSGKKFLKARGSE